MKKIIEIFKHKFTLFSFLQLTTSIIMFLTLVVLVFPETKAAFEYIFNINTDVVEEIYGYTFLVKSKAIFYFIMFSIQIIYSAYGISCLFNGTNERRIFKIMFRSIFYIDGILLFYNITAFVYFLITPITDRTSIYCVLFLILAILIAIFGRLVSNFTLYTAPLKNRKYLGIAVIIGYIIMCFISFFVLDEEFYTEAWVFYSLQTVASIFALLATIFFKDPKIMKFKDEPTETIINNKKAIKLKDIPEDLKEINDSLFRKNLTIEKASIPKNIKEIGARAFSNCLHLKKVIIPQEVKNIKECAFYNCGSLESIIYEGTKEEFEKITLGKHWIELAGTNQIKCVDGTITLDK